MSFLLDADTIIRYLRNHRTIKSHILKEAGRLHISVATVTEVELYLPLRTTPISHHQGYFSFLNLLQVEPVDVIIAQKAASLGSSCRRQGFRFSVPDLHLAATTIERKLTLVTPNHAYYSRIPGLNLVDWRKP